jgi:hypothetical protein
MKNLQLNTQFIKKDNFIFDHVLNEEDIEQILLDNSKKQLYFKIRDINFGKYAMNFCNRIKKPCVLIFECSKNDILDLFKFFLTSPFLNIRVEPFNSIVENTVCSNNCKNIESVLLESNVPADIIPEMKQNIQKILEKLTKISQFL